MTAWRAGSLAGMALAVLAALFAVSSARADGEAGLVVQHADGTVETTCVAFTGSGISGDALLRAAGVPFEQLGGLVCAVGSNPAEGCHGATSLESCTCRCRPGSSDCVYWSYFTRRYGQGWVYSAIGFTGQVSRDGDLQAWRWGKGGPTSAPAPADVTFEQVCGHAPGLAAPTATSVPPTSVPATAAPTNSTVATVVGGTPDPSPGAATSPIVTITRPATALAPPSTATAPASAVPGRTAAADETAGGGGGSSSLVAFAVVAAAMAGVGAVGAAWKKRRDR